MMEVSGSVVHACATLVIISAHNSSSISAHNWSSAGLYILAGRISPDGYWCHRAGIGNSDIGFFVNESTSSDVRLNSMFFASFWLAASN